MAVRLSALRTGRRITPQKHYFYASGTHFCIQCVYIYIYDKLYVQSLQTPTVHVQTNTLTVAARTTIHNNTCVIMAWDEKIYAMYFGNFWNILKFPRRLWLVLMYSRVWQCVVWTHCLHLPGRRMSTVLKNSLLLCIQPLCLSSSLSLHPWNRPLMVTHSLLHRPMTSLYYRFLSKSHYHSRLLSPENLVLPRAYVPSPLSSLLLVLPSYIPSCLIPTSLRYFPTPVRYSTLKIAQYIPTKRW
jgi:hypothetical protein